MIIYWVLLLVTYLLYFVIYSSKQNKKIKKKIFLIFSSLPAILIMGLRSVDVGIDTIAYVRNFTIICDLGWTDFRIDIGNVKHYEFAYFYLNKIISIFSKDPQILLFVCSVLIIGCTYYAIYLFSDDVLLSVSIYQTLGFYCFSIALMRQFLAISILLISFYFFVNCMYSKTFFLVCTAGLFHSTAFIFLGIYFFLAITYKFKNTKFGVTFVVCLFIPIAYKIIIYTIPRYQFYLTYTAQNIISSGLFALFIFGIVVLPFIFGKMNEIQNNKDITYLLQLLIIGACINFLARYISMLGRIVYMFTIFSVFYIPKLLNKLVLSKQNKIIISMIIYVVQFSYYFKYLYYATGQTCPYVFFWN